MDQENDQQHIWVIGRGGIEVLNAHCVGDWFIQLHIGILSNPSGAPLQRYLTQQLPNFCALIKIFGHNQFVLVATAGDPLSPKQTAVFSPQTLHPCSYLTCTCWLVRVHGVPESSGARLHGQHQAGTFNCRRAEWTQATFHENRERFGDFCYIIIDLPTDRYGQYLFNEQPLTLTLS